MKFENTRVWGFESALRGMRNAKESWGRNDSKEFIVPIEGLKDYHNVCQEYDNYYAACVEIGPNDMKLAQTLIKSGSEHRKFMRQIFVSVDITAPLKFWKEFDTYRIGVTENSTSTMHKLADTPITIDCFEIDRYNPQLPIQCQDDCCYDVLKNETNRFIRVLEDLRSYYNESQNKEYWEELIRWLPDGWLQKRTVTMNYENIYCMTRQRKYHKQNEWSGRDNPELPNFIGWARSLPYADELIFYRYDEPERAATAGAALKKILDKRVNVLTMTEDLKELGISCFDGDRPKYLSEIMNELKLKFDAQ